MSGWFHYRLGYGAEVVADMLGQIVHTVYVTVPCWEALGKLLAIYCAQKKVRDVLVRDGMFSETVRESVELRMHLGDATKGGGSNYTPEVFGRLVDDMVFL